MIDLHKMVLEAKETIDRLLLSRNDYWFTWQNVPGTETDTLILKLDEEFDLGLKKPATTIKKIDEKTLDISSEEHHVSVTLSDQTFQGGKGKLLFTIDDKPITSTWLNSRAIATIEGESIRVFGQPPRIPSHPTGPPPPPPR